MKLLLAMLLLMQSPAPECASTLTLRGVGSTAARQVGPYVDCLNSKIATAEHISAACSGAREKAAGYHGSTGTKSKVDRAIHWLDAMVRERATCETHLEVNA